MKKLLVFIFVLLWSKFALADGGIPLLVLLGSNLFIVSSLTPPFVFGLFLFLIVCVTEKWYLRKKLNIKEKITKYIVVANLYSTLCGIPVSIGLYFLQEILCRLFPYSGSDGRAICSIVGPLAITPIVELFVLGVITWFVEYWYLKKKLTYPHLKKYVAFANLYSYLGMVIICLIFLLSFLDIKIVR